MEAISVERLLELIADYFKRLPYKYETPLYGIGDVVQTKGDKEDSYITIVIGAKRQGKVLTDCSIPLIDFGKKGTFYVHQDKLKLIFKSKI